ncbi:unnamed protein product [Heterobilharzia americana]|nr:unnamed protein product [Heterobilharzia americana]
MMCFLCSSLLLLLTAILPQSGPESWDQPPLMSYKFKGRCLVCRCVKIRSLPPSKLLCPECKCVILESRLRTAYVLYEIRHVDLQHLVSGGVLIVVIRMQYSSLQKSKREVTKRVNKYQSVINLSEYSD